ncbi:Endonuclease/exonuclease/phosphatase [Apiospora arundinis]
MALPVPTGLCITQSHYVFNHDAGTWEEEGQMGAATQCPRGYLSRLAVYSWNIDYALPFAPARMRTALEALEYVICGRFQTSPETAVVIFFQECVKSDLETLAESKWVRGRFALTELPSDAWNSWRTSGYGTTALLDRRLEGCGVFRVYYGAETQMRRDALFADVTFHSDTRPREENLFHRDVRTVRLCTTHLESLPDETNTPPLRARQMGMVADYLKKKARSGSAGIVAGDFNAIQDFDRSLHAEHGLRDAYLEMGGREDCDEAYTWGQQAKTAERERFGCARMDKVLFFNPGVDTAGSACAGAGAGAGDANKDEVIRLLRFERFGAGVELPATTEGGEEQRAQLVDMGFDKPWITDHLGVMAEFDIVFPAIEVEEKEAYRLPVTGRELGEEYD